MSFIEKNKAWLLPLLGLGILGVGYMNFRTLSGEPPPPEAAPEAPSPAGAPSSASPETPLAEGTVDLWSDLKPFAVLPGNLAQEGVLRDRARVALGPELGLEAPLSLGKPGWASLAPAVVPAQGAGLDSAGGGAPELDFLIHGPRGSFAWFGGKPYQAGEKLLDSGYTVTRIGPTSVELSGPQGKLVESTIPVAIHSTEAP